MTTNGESKFSSSLIGLGLGAIAGLMAVILARKKTGELLRERSINGLDYLNQQAGKLRESTDAIVQQGKKFIGCKGSALVDHSTRGEKQAYQEDRRENLGAKNVNSRISRRIRS